MSAGRWAELVEAWAQSGRSAKDFADEHSVAEGSLRWWKTELARRARNAPARRSPGPGRKRDRVIAALARVVREGDAPPSSTDDAANPPVVIVVGAAKILVQHDFDAKLLRAVVHALGERP